MVALLLPSTLGIILFGAVRHWSAGLLMVPVFFAWVLFVLRPFWNREFRTWRFPPGAVGLALCAVYVAIRIPFSAVPYESLVEFLKILSYLAAFWIWATYADGNKRWRILLFIPLLLGTLVALYAVVLHLRGSSAVLMLVRHEQYGLRASGTFMAPAHMGAYMGTIICLALALVLMKDAGFGLRLFGGYSLLVALPALFLSGSRSGWFGTTLGVIVLLGLWAGRRGWRTLAVTLGALVGSGVASFWGLWIGSEMFRDRIGSALRVEGSAAWRIDAWQDTWRMFLDRMGFGFGPGTYRWTYPPFQTWSGYRWLRYAHNEYLHALAEYGVVGTAFLAIVILGALGGALRLFCRTKSIREADLLAGFIAILCAALGHAVFDFNFHVYSLVHLIVAIGGVTFAMCFRSGLLRERMLDKRACFALGLGVAGLALWAAVASFQVGASAALVRLAEDDMENIDLRQRDPYQAARQKYEWAKRLDSAHWMPYAGLAEIARSRAIWLPDPAVRTQTLQQALDLYRQAYERNPRDMNVVYGIAQVQQRLGNNEQALVELKRAVAYWPANVFYSYHLALQLHRLDRNEEALAVVEAVWRHDGFQDPRLRQLRQRLRTAVRE